MDEATFLILLGLLLLLVERIGYHRFGWKTGWNVAGVGCIAIAAGIVSILLEFL